MMASSRSCDNSDCDGEFQPGDLHTVTLREDYGGSNVVWCLDCIQQDEEQITDSSVNEVLGMPSSTTTHYAIYNAISPRTERRDDFPIVTYRGEPALFRNRKKALVVRDNLNEKHDGKHLQVTKVEIGGVIPNEVTA
jgi:hypothetical protein